MYALGLLDLSECGRCRDRANVCFFSESISNRIEWRRMEWCVVFRIESVIAVLPVSEHGACG